MTGVAATVTTPPRTPVGDRISQLIRITVCLSAAAAVVFEAWLGAREWPQLLALTVGAFFVALLVGRRWPIAVSAVILGSAYILPALAILTLGRSLIFDHSIWFAALLGSVLARRPGRRWASPAIWAPALAYWALVVAVSWPIVVAREADFAWSMLSNYHVGNSGLGGPPPIIAIMIANVALTHLTGILFFDHCFAEFPPGSGVRFRRAVLWPLGAGFVLAAALAVYQGLVDISFLSGHQWPAEGRAAGGLVDGDAFGALAGFWSLPILLVGGVHWAGIAAGVGGSMLALGAVWASGSRMALASGMMTVAIGAAFALRERRFRWAVLALVAASITLGGLAATGKISFGTVNPLARMWATLPELKPAAIKGVIVRQLYNRDAPFGTASMIMVREFPSSGVGVGSFNHLFPDYAYRVVGHRHTQDNAQSWYRHQWAELGLLGSLGWMWWLGTVVWFGITTRREPELRPTLGILTAALISIGISSLVSMPTQSPPVALTVWVFCFWHLTISPTARQRVSGARISGAGALWVAVLAATLCFLAATYINGWTALRPPYRAARADWTYQVGFSDLQTPGDRYAFRWTEKHAVIVLPVTGPWLKLTVSGGPTELAPGATSLVVRRLGKTIASVERLSAEPITWYVLAPTTARRMMLEFDAGRTFTLPGNVPLGNGLRDVGVAVDDWTFVDTPPRGAVVIR